MKRKTKIRNKKNTSKKYIWIISVLSVCIAVIFLSANHDSSLSGVLGSSLTPTPTCTPPPSCVYSVPKCLLPEPAGGWCPIATTTPSPTATPTIPPTNTPYPSPTPTSMPSNQWPTPTATSSDTVAPTLPSDNSFDQTNQSNFSNEGTENTDISPQAGGAGIQYDYHSDQNELGGQNQETSPTQAIENNQSIPQRYPTEALPPIDYQFISPTPEQKSTNPVVSLFITINNSISNFVKSLFKFH